MLARVLEHWLTSAGELSYQGPFTQLLISEGYVVLSAPVHHPFEHGKDLVAWSQDGALCAFQLKGGNIDKSSLGDLIPQLVQLTTIAVSYPGVEPPRRADRAFLVTNGTVSPPAQDAIRAFNDGNRTAGLPIVTLVEKESLVARFLKQYAELLPSEPYEFNELLRLLLADGTEECDSRRLYLLLTGMINRAAELRTGKAQIARALASCVLLTAQCSSPSARLGNHLALAQAWMVMSFVAMRTAARWELDASLWQASFRIARDSVRGALGSLAEEAGKRDDVVVPDLTEGLVYGTRVCVISGALAAFILSERVLGTDDAHLASAKKVILRELPYLKAVGECSAASIYLMSLSLEAFEELEKAALLQLQWASLLARANAPGSKAAVPDPYHTVAECLDASFDGGPGFGGESFDGQAYTLHVSLYWMARRGLRELVGAMWREVTHIHFTEYVPGDPLGLLTLEDDTGQQVSWAPKMPQSWAELTIEANRVDASALPPLLWENREMIPYLPFLFPHRLTSDVSKALDFSSFGTGTLVQPPAVQS